MDHSQTPSGLRTNRINVAILIILFVVTFLIFTIPNSKGADDPQMVQIFEQDESAPLGYLYRMLSPSETLKQAILKFFFYKYYFYGFPHFLLSALATLPLALLDRLNDYPAVLLVLRQVSSVVPMLAGILILVYMQDKFRTYRSIVLFLLLVSVPAVVTNNFWWHPDGLVCLTAFLVLFFLQRDNLRFGRNFLLAAVACGIATATKIIGLYFFGAVGLALLLGFLLRKAPPKRLVGMALAFLLVMGLSFVAANPFLLYPQPRATYFITMQKQVTWLQQGYGVLYAKGLLASWPIVNRYFGEALFILLCLGTAVFAAIRGPQRLLNALFIAWFLPVTVVVFFLTHFKFQYWMPAMLPIVSSVVVWLPEKWPSWRPFAWKRFLQVAGLLIILVQFGLFVYQDVAAFNRQIHREETSPSIRFYPLAEVILDQVYIGTQLHLYYDYGVYLPRDSRWYADTYYGLLEYQFIEVGNFDVLLLEEQRIRDYLNPNVSGIDANLFARSQVFYRDADQGSIKNYHLVFRNDFGLVFVREDLSSKVLGP